MTEQNTSRGNTPVSQAYDDSAEQLNYYTLIRGWATDRSILGGDSTPIDQFTKGLSEGGELWDHLGKNKLEGLKDDIGDILVCLTNAYAIMGINIEDVGSFSAEEYETVKSFYADYENRRLKRLGLVVARSLADISYIIEDVQFLEGETDLESLEETTGHLIAVLMLMAEDNGWTLTDCLSAAWDDIKDRKGVMLEGTFLKEDDIKTVDQALNIRDKLRPGKPLDYINDLIQRLMERDEAARVADKYPDATGE